jgi:hypothetical protein
MLDTQVQTLELTSDVCAPDALLAVLEHRLERGWQIIESKEAAGESTEALVAHFVSLLREYEAAYDLSHAA